MDRTYSLEIYEDANPTSPLNTGYDLSLGDNSRFYDFSGPGSEPNSGSGTESARSEHPACPDSLKGAAVVAFFPHEPRA